MQVSTRSKPINWIQLYTSRFFRLVPLYLFSIFLLFGTVIILSHFQIHGSVDSIIKNCIKWLSFMGRPDLNGVHKTWIIDAGVTWTLTYEVLFYLSLPILAIFLLAFPPLYVFGFSLFAISIQLHFWRPSLICIVPFAGGIVAAFIVRWSVVRTHLCGTIAAIFALAVIVGVVVVFPTAYNLPALSLLAIAFCIIACGNTLFGILSSPLSRMLGEISYSTYLLQGIILFVTFRFIVGYARAATFSPFEHWLTILCCTAFLIPFCSLTFRYIEAPAMRAVPTATVWVQRWLTRQVSLGKSVLTRKFDTVRQTPHDDSGQ